MVKIINLLILLIFLCLFGCSSESFKNDAIELTCSYKNQQGWNYFDCELLNTSSDTLILTYIDTIKDIESIKIDYGNYSSVYSNIIEIKNSTDTLSSLEVKNRIEKLSTHFSYAYIPPKKKFNFTIDIDGFIYAVDNLSEYDSIRIKIPTSFEENVLKSFTAYGQFYKDYMIDKEKYHVIKDTLITNWMKIKQ